MNTSTAVAIRPTVPIGHGVYDADELLYPDSDGRPMSDNTIQYRWIVTIKENLDLLYKDRSDVFVAGDLLWYAVKEDSKLRQSPDVLVAVGRPKMDRGSYRQWEENGVPPQVVFEIMSPGNRAGEMTRKFEFYDRYGVEEYYIYEPKDGDLSVWMRGSGETGDGENRLRAVNWQDEHVSPILGIRFVPHMDADMEIFYPDGRRFLTLQQMDDARERAEANAQRAEAERDSAVARAERLAIRLRELGIDPDEA
ncbi:MAG: Uma2 family endonuclease [Akkermansiaceae bacterium]|nr:Uma2 family endonuclease [Armatimonadota bacterium]